MQTMICKAGLTLAATLACAAALADASTSAAFEPAVACENVKGYDPDWASYGDEYGLKLKRGQDYAMIFGFYQFAERAGKLYATFGGALSENSAPVKGATPGMLVVLDADTLRFERSLPLPFHAHALAMDPVKNRAIASHTVANGFSIIDIEKGTVRCLVPKIEIGGKKYHGRYIAADDRGDFYISYYSGWREGENSVVVKYGADGAYAKDFSVNVLENNVALPVHFIDGELLAGGKGLKKVDTSTGDVQKLTPEDASLMIYNYTKGPGGTFIGAHNNWNVEGRPNLVMIDPQTNSQSSIYTGSGSVEIAYVAETGQVFSTNFNSKTLTVAALPADARGFAQSRFVNIQFEGEPATLLARHTATATEVFVTPKVRDEENNTARGALIKKISLSRSVKGIEGIDKPGACTVTTFNMADKSVSKAEPCRILDAKASYRADVQLAQRRLVDLESRPVGEAEELSRLRDALAKARKNVDTAAIAKAEQEIKEYESGLAWTENAIANTRIAIEVLNRMAATK